MSGEEASFNWPKFIKEHKNDGPGRYVTLIAEILASDADLFPTLKQGARIKLEDIGFITDDRTYEDGRKAVEYVEATDFDASDEFLFVNLMDAYGPYKEPPEYRTVEPIHISATERMLSDDPEPVSSEDVMAAYEDCVRYLSDVYERLHGLLAEEFDCVITMADHGEAFGEYGKWGHSRLIPEVTNVPLSIHTTDRSCDLTPTDQPVNLHDIFQTVCDMADVRPPERTRGTSLADDGVSDSRYKLLETHGLSTEMRNKLVEEGYDRDTIERQDQRLHAIASRTGYAFQTTESSIEYVGEEIPDAESKMESLASDIERREDTDAVEIPEAVHERLKELGYA